MNEENKNTLTLLTHEAHKEHAELRHLIETVKQRIDTARNTKARDTDRDLIQAIKQLCDHVEEHFQREENGGWLEEAVVRAPHLARRLGRLERQHKPLCQRVQRLVAAAEAGKQGDKWLNEFEEKFAKFGRQLLAHETCEERVLQKGFNDDLEID